VEGTERLLLLLRSLNQILVTGIWRVYERKEKPNWVRLVLGIDTAFVTLLEGLRWRLLSLFWALKAEGKK
jgi:hypothetical protein